MTLSPQRGGIPAQVFIAMYIFGKAALTCLVDGAELMGIFSGNPANEDQYGSNQCHAFEGRAVAVVRTSTPGVVKLTVGSEGLYSGSTTVIAE